MKLKITANDGPPHGLRVKIRKGFCRVNLSMGETREAWHTLGEILNTIEHDTKE